MSEKQTHIVIPAQVGIQHNRHSAKRTNSYVDPLRGNFVIDWIPAYAGMTA